MKVNDSEFNRCKEINEYITTAHILSFFVILVAIIASGKVFPMEGYVTLTYKDVNVRWLFLSALFVFIMVIFYNTKDSGLFRQKRTFYVDALYIVFTLLIATITLFITGDSGIHTSMIFILPVLVAGSIMGRIPGMVTAGISTVVLLFYSLYISGFKAFSFTIIQENIIVILVMFIIGWFIGGQAEIEAKNRKNLMYLANTDLLTGLYNHRYFHENLKMLFDNINNHSPLSLIQIDIDYFKHYNDCFGHQAGDQVLSSIGQIISEAISESGFAARYEGGAYIAVLPKCHSEKARSIAQGIRDRVREKNFPGGEYQPGGKVTVSCGVATYPEHAEGRKELIWGVDQALYRAKSLNKDKVDTYFSVFNNLELNQSEKELINSIRTLISIINAKDKYTYGHSERVSDNALRLARKMRLSEEKIHLLTYAAFLHDIGKIEIDRAILNKRSKLDHNEWDILKNHPRWGSEIIKGVSKLQPVASIVLHHHENYDGTGYPDGLAGENIPLLSRIIRVVDSYDAMITYRPYRNSLSVEEAINELLKHSGTMFDPLIVKNFVELLYIEGVFDAVDKPGNVVEVN